MSYELLMEKIYETVPELDLFQSVKDDEEDVYVRDFDF